MPNRNGGCVTRLDPASLPWEVVNDGVMGGLSRGRVQATDHGVKFDGALSIENQGGFSSIRAPISGFHRRVAGFRLTVTGDGRRYQFRLRENDRSSAIAWRALFDTSGARQTIVLEPGDFEPVLRGRRVDSAPPLDVARVRLLGFMLTSRQPGPFELDVHLIETVAGTPRND